MHRRAHVAGGRPPWILPRQRGAARGGGRRGRRVGVRQVQHVVQGGVDVKGREKALLVAAQRGREGGVGGGEPGGGEDAQEGVLVLHAAVLRARKRGMGKNRP